MPIDNTEMPKPWLVQAVQTLGISTAAAVALAYFAYNTITWEREQMLPAVHGAKTAIEGNTKALEDNAQVLKDVREGIQILTNQHIHSSRNFPVGRVEPSDFEEKERVE